MKEKIFSSQPLLGLILTAVSAIAAAMIPSKGNVPDQLWPDQAPGISFISSGGIESTIKAGAGLRSYTETGAPGDNNDGASATSIANDDNGTITFNAGCATGNNTTALDDEQNCIF